jgi:hypothetical protein
LLVALDCIDAPRLRRVDVFPEFSPSTTLAKEIPALVEGLFDSSQALYVSRGAISANSVFFIHQCGDVLKDLSVIHGRPLARRGAHSGMSRQPETGR